MSATRINKINITINYLDSEKLDELMFINNLIGFIKLKQKNIPLDKFEESLMSVIKEVSPSSLKGLLKLLALFNELLYCYFVYF